MNTDKDKISTPCDQTEPEREHMSTIKADIVHLSNDDSSDGCLGFEIKNFDIPILAPSSNSITSRHKGKNSTVSTVEFMDQGRGLSRTTPELFTTVNAKMASCQNSNSAL